MGAPSLRITSNDTIVCRIVGRNMHEVRRAEYYDFKLHSLGSNAGDITNEILRGKGSVWVFDMVLS